MKRGLLWILVLCVPTALSIGVKRLFPKKRDTFLKDDLLITSMLNHHRFYSQTKEELASQRKRIAYIEYTVQRGDSIWAISKRFSLDVPTIASVNRLTSNKLMPGDVLKIPNQKGILYKVKSGQTLWDIARMYNISLKKINEVNNLSSSLIVPGQVIFLPDARPRRNAIFSHYGKPGFIKPAFGYISSGFGWRRHPISRKLHFHKGIDIRAPYGSSVRAAAPGRVVFCGWKQGYGWTVIIRHNRKYRTLYAHLSAMLVRRGEFVEQYQVIGKVGNSGRTTGANLHFEVHKNSRPTNPISVLR